MRCDSSKPTEQPWLISGKHDANYAGDPLLGTRAPERPSGPRSDRAPIADAATPIPAASVAPVPPRPTALGYHVSKTCNADLEPRGFSQCRTGICQYSHKNHTEHDDCRNYAHQVSAARYGGRFSGPAPDRHRQADRKVPPGG